MKRSVLAGALAALVLGTGVAAAEDIRVGDLVIESPFTRATPPGAPVAGGYMIIRNEGDQADRLLSASAPFAAMVELHAMTMENDVMRMRPVADGFVVPAGESVALEPGGLHVMFMNPDADLKEGETRTATLTFERAGEVMVVFPVLGLGDTPAADEGGHGAHGGAHSN